MTTSVCGSCYRNVPAEISVAEDGVWLTKCCPEHGESRILVERDPAWYSAAKFGVDDPVPWKSRFNVTILDVTDRCNVRCPHCYHMPGKTPDRSIDQIVSDAKSSTKSDAFILMGAEPTMRDDLTELIREINGETGKLSAIYTNGVNLADPRKVLALRDAGLQTVCFSLHTKGYLSDPRFFTAKRDALANIAMAGLCIDHISFSMRSLDDLDEILRLAYDYWSWPLHYRIRIPSKIGRCMDKPFFLSEMFPVLKAKCDEFGWKCELMPADNNAYHVMASIEGKPFRLIRWPSIDEMDYGELDCPPYALFLPELGETNFVHQALMQEAVKTKKIDRAELARRHA